MGFADIADTVKKIIDADVEWTAEIVGFEGSVSSGFNGRNATLGTAPIPFCEVKIGPAPGFDITGPFGSDVDLSSLESTGDYTYRLWHDMPGLLPKYPFTVFDAKSYYDDVKSFWENIFEGCDDDSLPDPDWLLTRSKEMFAAAEKITAVPVASSGSADLKTLNGDLGAAMKQLDTKLANMQGRTIDAFALNYAYQFPVLLQGNYGLASLAGLILEGKSKIWKGARNDLGTLAGEALKAMEARGPSEDDFPLEVVAALAGIGSVIPGPQQPFVAGAATVLGALSTLQGDDEPEDPRPKLAGDAPVDVQGNAKDGIKDIIAAIQNREAVLESRCSDAIQTATSGDETTRENFNLPTPKLLNTENNDQIVASKSDLKTLATLTLPSIRNEIANGATLIDGVQYDDDAHWSWYLYTTYDPAGGLTKLRDLIDLNVDLLLEAKWEVAKCADHLEIAANDLNHSDAAVDAALQKRARKVADVSPYADDIADTAEDYK